MENKPFIKTEVKVKPEPDSKAWLSLPKFERRSSSVSCLASTIC